MKHINVNAIMKDNSIPNPVFNPVFFVSTCDSNNCRLAQPILSQLGLKSRDNQYSHWLDNTFPNKNSLTRTDEAITSLKSAINLDAETENTSTILLADTRNVDISDNLAACFPEARFILFYTHVETELAHALGNQTDPEECIENWIQANQLILDFQRRYRNRSLLFEAEAVANHNANFIAECERINLFSNENCPTTNNPEIILLGSLERLLAKQYLMESGEASKLQQELEASTIPLSGDPSREAPNLQVAITEFLELTQRIQENECDQAKIASRVSQIQSNFETVEKNLRLSTQENKLLISQLDQTRNELQKVEFNREQFELRIRELDDALDNANQQTKRLNLESEATSRRLTNADSETQQLRSELEREKCLTQQETQDLHQVTNNLSKEKQLLELQLQQIQTELEYFTSHHIVTAKQTDAVVDPAAATSSSLANEATAECQSVSDQGEKETSTPIKTAFRKPFQSKKEKGKARTKAKNIEQSKIELIKHSGLFDDTWYRSKYPDIANSNIDPVKHYIRYGASEDRNPSPAFDTKYYLGENPDVANAGVNPLIHFIRFGRNEGRTAMNPKFWH